MGDHPNGSDRVFERLARFAAYVRANPRFDHEERECKHTLAETVKELLQTACVGAPIGGTLERLAAQSGDPRRPYHVLTPPAIEWISGWAATDEASLSRALALCSEQGKTATERFATFEVCASEAARRGVAREAPKAMMAFASLINFALGPQSIPVVRTEPFERLQRTLGYDTGPPGSPLELYLHHVEFARRLSARLSDAGIAMRDAMDVQAVIFLADATHFRLESGGEVPPPDAEPPDGAGLRRRRRPDSYLAICACIGYESSYLAEWIEFHRLLGVERFYLYNSREREDQRKVLDPYIRSGLVQLRDWDPFPPQLPAYQHCLEQHRDDARWIAFLDADEFLFPPQGESLPRKLRDFEANPGVGVNLALFGPCGHRERPAGLVSESYDRSVPSRFVKTIVDPTRVVACRSPHFFIYDEGFAVDENRHPIWRGETTYVSFSGLRVNHYYTKSEAEFRDKETRARADTGEIRAAGLDRILEQERRLAERDDAIAQYLPQLRRALGATPTSRTRSRS